MTGGSRTLRVGEGELFYEARGDGRDLVLLHDGLLDRRVWDGQFEALSRVFRVIRYDRRGYGASSTPHRPFSDTSDLHRLLRHLEVSEVCLAGISNGGKVALEFALEHPGMVGAMVLTGPSLDGYRISEEKKRRVEAIFRVARERGVDAGIEAWMADPFYPPTDEKIAAREKVRPLMAHILPRLLSTPNLRQGPDVPVVGALCRIVAPTLILVGERDDPDNLAIASVLEDGLPQATKLVINGSGHLVNLEAPEVFERLVKGWIGGANQPPLAGRTVG